MKSTLKKLPLIGVLFLLLTLGYGMYLDESYMGAHTLLIYRSPTSPSFIEVRKVYPSRDRYWRFGPEPAIVGYYVTFFLAKGSPPSATVLINQSQSPSSINVESEKLGDFKVYFDGRLIVTRNGSVIDMKE